MRLLAALFLLVFSQPAHSEFQLSLGSDIRHAPGLSSWSIRYGERWGFRAGAIIMPETKSRGAKVTESVWVVGLDHQWRFTDWNFGLGAVKISDTTKLNGTEWNFDLSAQYKLGGGAFLEFRHYSHGSMFGIAADKSNRGWNFLGLGYAWK